MQVRGRPGGGESTIAGYKSLVGKLEALSGDIQELRAAARGSSAQADDLLHSMQVLSFLVLLPGAQGFQDASAEPETALGC